MVTCEFYVNFTIDQDHLSGGGSCLALLSIMLCAFCKNMAAAFTLAVVQDTLEHLDSYQDGDYSGILLRLEYLNRIIINFWDLPDSIVGKTKDCDRPTGLL